jgi:hypothetical protein
MFAVGSRTEPAASATAGRPLKTERPQTPTGTNTPSIILSPDSRPRTQVRLGARAQSTFPARASRTRTGHRRPRAQTSLDHRVPPQVRLHPPLSNKATGPRWRKLRKVRLQAPASVSAWLMTPRAGSGSASTRTGFASARRLRGMRRLCTASSRTPRLWAWLGQRPRLSARAGTWHDRRRDRRLENRWAWSVHSRDRSGRPAGGRPSRSHDFRHTRLDALELGKCRKSCSARAWLGLDTGALGPRICDRSSRSHPGTGHMSVDPSTGLSL